MVIKHMAFLLMIMEALFILSDNINKALSNESTAAELSGGKLMMNSRNQSGDVKARIVSVSSDGGLTWDTTYFDKTLFDPVNEGSLLTVGITKGKNIISFCNAAHTKHRDRLTLPISYDDGKSWKNPYEIDKSADGSEGDNTGYSDIVRLSRKKIGVLYKEGNLQ